MRSLLTCACASLVLGMASTALAQCPPSRLIAELLEEPTPGCVTIAADPVEPLLNITNACDEDQFHVEGGLDCPHCGPPATLRPGTFGSFAAETRALTEFEIGAPAEEHTLSWASGESIGTMRVRVTPDIYPCPDPDIGEGADGGGTVMEPEAPTDDGSGCCGVARGDASPIALLLFAASAARRRKRDRDR